MIECDLGAGGEAIPLEDGEYRVVLLASPYLDACWPLIERELEKIPHTWERLWSKEGLYAAVMDGSFDVWTFGPGKEVRLVVFTAVVQFHNSRALQVQFAFGNSFEAAFPLLEATFERYAAIQKCDRIEVIGRKGWARRLRRNGYVVESIIVSKPVQKMEMQ